MQLVSSFEICLVTTNYICRNTIMKYTGMQSCRYTGKQECSYLLYWSVEIQLFSIQECRNADIPNTGVWKSSCSVYRHAGMQICSMISCRNVVIQYKHMEECDLQVYRDVERGVFGIDHCALCVEDEYNEWVKPACCFKTKFLKK